MNGTELHPLVVQSPEHAQDLVQRYASLSVPKEHVQLFSMHLIGRTDSWFLEVGDEGLIYLTNVVPRFKADFNMVFWDSKLPKLRRRLASEAIRKAMHEFDLRRIQAFVRQDNVPYRTALVKIGFVLEGCMRNAFVDEGGLFDLCVYGLLSGELRG